MNEIWHPCAGYETHYEVTLIAQIELQKNPVTATGTPWQ